MNGNEPKAPASKVDDKSANPATPVTTPAKTDAAKTDEAKAAPAKADAKAPAADAKAPTADTKAPAVAAPAALA